MYSKTSLSFEGGSPISMCAFETRVHAWKGFRDRINGIRILYLCTRKVETRPYDESIRGILN
jgi:hypothetical protein